MNKKISGCCFSSFKKVATAILVMITTIIIPSMLTSCEIDDAMPGGGSITGSSNTNRFVGTWSRQIQWAYTDGTREDTYVIRSGGTGTLKRWKWLDQKFVTKSFSWSAYGDYIEISGSDFSTSGYINSGGSAIKIGDWWYNKK